MKLNNNYKKIIACVLIASSIFAYSAAAHAAINKQINYQGKLANNLNVPVTDGTYAMQFNLYTQLSGGSPVWTENLTGGNEVQVTDGLFSVMLGALTPLTGVDFNQTLYLGVTIESDGEMSPRKILGAVPAAFVADTLDNLSSEQFLRSDTQNATSSSSTFLSILQTGAGKIAEFFGSASQSVLALLSNGNVGIGTTTPYAKLSVAGQTVSEYFTATGTTASTLPYASTTALTVSGALYNPSLTDGCLTSVSGLVTSTGALCGGSGSQTPWLANVDGAGFDLNDVGTVTARNFIATSSSAASIFPYASTTALTVSGTNGLTLASLTGPLQALNGVVSATSTLSTFYGGTGISTAPTYGQLLLGNALGGYSLTATSSLGLVQASDLASYLSLASWFATTTDGLAQGISNLYYSNSLVNSFIHASTTIPKTYTANTFTGAQTFNGGLTVGSLSGPLQAINGAVSATSTLSQVYGGTGFSSYVAGNILYANSSGNLTRLPISSDGLVLKLSGGLPSWQTDLTSGGGGGSTAWSTTTDSLAIYPTDTTDVLIVGSNATTSTGNIFEVVGNSKFGGNASVTGSLTVGTLDGVLYGTSGSVGTIATSSLGLPTFANLASYFSLASWYATTTDGLAPGISNLYYSNSLVNSFIHASSTIPKTYTANTFTGAQTFNGGITLGSALTVANGGTGQSSFGQGWLNSNGTSITSSTSPTVNYITSTSTATSTFTGGIQTNLLNVTSATASSSFANGINLAAGCFAVNNTCLTNSTYGDTNVNAFIHASTTIPKTYTANTFSALQTFTGGLTTNALTIGSITGLLQGVNGTVSATSSPTISYITATSTTATSTFPNISISNSMTTGQVIVTHPNGVKNIFTATSTSVLGMGYTIKRAFNYATAGDTIEVGPGTYDVSEIWKDKVNWYFYPGAVIDATTGVIFNDNAAVASTTIGGYGKFISDLYNVISMNNTNSYISIHAEEMRTKTGSNSPLQSSAGTAYLDVVTGIYSETYDAVVLGTGRYSITTYEMKGGDDWIEYDAGGDINIKIHKGENYPGATGGFCNDVTGVPSSGSIIIHADILVGGCGSGGVPMTLYVGEIRDGGVFNSEGTTTAQVGVYTNSRIISNSGALNILGGKMFITTTNQDAVNISGGTAYIKDMSISGVSGTGKDLKQTGGTLSISNVDYNVSNTSGTLTYLDAEPFVYSLRNATSNVGIGTTTPYAKLSVVGEVVASKFTATTTATSTFTGGIQTNLLNVTSATASSSFANGINLAAGCFAVNNTCLTNSTYGDTNVNAFIHASTTIPKTYTANTFSALQTFTGGLTTNALTIGSITGLLQGVNGTVSATSSPTISYITATSTTVASTFPYASTTAITSSGSAYFATGFGGLLIGTTTATSSSKLTLAGGNFIHTAVGNPTLKGSYVPAFANNPDVFVSGRYAYVVDLLGGLKIIDVNDPSLPSLISTQSISSFPRSVYVSGKYAYVVATSNLKIIDVSNPKTPVVVGSYTTSSPAYGVYVSGKYAYVADFDSGLLIVDVSNPTAPFLVGSYNTSGFSFKVYVSGKYAYVADTSGDLQIIDISNPVAPAFIKEYNGAGGLAYDIYVSGRYAYLANDSEGLTIVDISDPTSPSTVGSYVTGGSAYAIYVSGKYAYVLDGTTGLNVINVSNPSSPSLVGVYSTSSGGYSTAGVYVSGKYAYVADAISGLLILDINGTETPTLSTGNIETGVLNATENIVSGGDIYAQGGLNVGISGIFSRGTISAFIASTTQINPVVANFMGGNVGIGTTSPGTLLSLGDTGANTINISATATSTFGSGLNIRTGCFAMNGTCVRESQWTASGSNIGYTAGNVGIGTVSPTRTLSLNATDGMISFNNADVEHWAVGNEGSASDRFSIFNSITSSYALNIDPSNNNIGLGTTSPGTKLSIGNTGNSTINISPTATSTFGFGINLRNGCFAIGGSCLSLSNIGGTLSVAKGGTGQTSFGQGWLGTDGTTITSSTSPTVNYITATSTIATSTFAGGATFATSAGSFGIGTSSPFTKFAVAGGTSTMESLLPSMAGGTGNVSVFSIGDTANRWNSGWFSTLNIGTSTWSINNGTNGRLSIFDAASGGGNERFSITTAGNVGIGTSSPYAKLSVAGAVAAEYFTATSTTATSTFNGTVVVASTTSQVNDLSSTKTLTAWGDSLTYGLNVTSDKAWPSVINRYLAVPFTQVNNYGITSEHSTTIKNRMSNSPERWGDFTVIWMGTNDLLYSESPATLIANITSMVNLLDNPKHYVILPPTGQSTDVGNSAYNTLVSTNNSIAAAFPNNYIDIRAYLISQYDSGIPQDVTDHANDVIPSSLRSDTIHMNEAGYRLVAQRIAQFINAQTPANEVLTFNSGDSIARLGKNFSNITSTSTLGNWFAGFSSGNPWTTGTYNYGIGSESALTLSTGSNNIFFGRQTLGQLTTGSNNVAIGYLSQFYNTTNSNNISIGQSSLYHYISDGGIGIGQNAGGDMRTGPLVAIGNFSFRNLTSGTSGGLVGLGTNTGYYSQTGSDNTFIGNYVGYQAGSTTATSLISGSQNTFLGAYSGSASNVSNASTLGYNATSTLSNSVVLGDYRVTKGGIGTSTPSAMWSVPGDIFFTATSTGMNGLNLTAGCFSINGTCLSSGSGSGTVNSGTTGQFGYYAGAGTAVTGTSSVFVATNQRIGIGTTTPSGKLHVAVSSASDVPLVLEGVNSQSGDYLSIFSTSTNKVVSIAPTSIRTGVSGATLKLAGVLNFPNSISGIGTDIDELNSGNTALYITPPQNGERIFIGTAAKAPYQLDLSHVTAGIGGLSNIAVNKVTVAGGSSELNSASSGTGLRYNGYYGFEIQGSDGGTLGATTAINNWGDSSFGVRAGTSNKVAQIIYQRAAGTGDLLQFKDSSFNKTSVFNKDAWLGVASSTPWRTLSVTGTAAFDGLTNNGTANYVCITAGKEITYSTTACSGLSSQNFKHNIESIPSGLSQIMQLRPVSFTYNTDVSPGDQSKHLGFIAEEVNKINPDLVAFDKDGSVRSVKYDEFAPVIVKAIQELDTKVSLLSGGTAALPAFEGIASSTADILASSTPSFIARIAGAVKEYIQSAGEWVISKITAHVALFDRVETQVAVISKGLEITDQATGQPYCVTIRNGDWSKVSGVCADTATTTQSTNIVPITQPILNPIIQATSTEPVIATSTPPVTPVVETPSTPPTPPTTPEPVPPATPEPTPPTPTPTPAPTPLVTSTPPAPVDNP